MIDEADIVDVVLIHPTSLSDEDIAFIEAEAMKEFIHGKQSFARCILVSYIEWLDVFAKSRSH